MVRIRRSRRLKRRGKMLKMTRITPGARLVPWRKSHGRNTRLKASADNPSQTPTGKEKTGPRVMPRKKARESQRRGMKLVVG